jgi:hypothetical protein
MNTEDFNNKWNEWLEDGHYGLDIQDEEVIEFLNEIFVDLTKIEGFKFYQIKQKFYFYCFYADNISLAMKSIIQNEIRRIMEKK